MKVAALTILLLAVVGCGASFHDTPDRAWRGTAFGRTYTARCVKDLRMFGEPSLGVWLWPDRILLDTTRCLGDEATRSTLAHEVAHLTTCGSNEACAYRQGPEWIRAGVTLQELGWPDPPALRRAPPAPPVLLD